MTQSLKEHLANALRLLQESNDTLAQNVEALGVAAAQLEANAVTLRDQLRIIGALTFVAARASGLSPAALAQEVEDELISHADRIGPISPGVREWLNTLTTSDSPEGRRGSFRVIE